MTESLRLTVIIPTLREAAHLPELLARLTGAGDLIETVIVSDGGSTDATVNIARAGGARVIIGPPGRGGQLGRGIAAATSAWLLLLHADSILSSGWDDAVHSTLARANTNCAYYGKLSFASADPRARLLETGVALRCAMFRLPYGDQGLLIHRDLLHAIGGMPDAPLMEDVLLARRLGRTRLAPMNLTIITDATSYARDGWFRRAATNLWRLARFLAGSPAATLATTYRR
jgi:rSAM/selenodomain-associated transferase 2